MIRKLVLKIFISIIFILIIFFGVSNSGFSQEETNSPELRIGAYLDLFYGYDMNKPTSEERLPYLYQHNRHASFNLNHGVISAELTGTRYRANLAFQSGSYVRDNYIDEPDIYKTIFNANVGFAFNSSQTIWLDVGIFGNSHLGFESTWSHPNFNVAHNLNSENVPYFMTGVKATFLPNEQWTIAVLLLNGWQRIKMVTGSSIPSLGTQVTYTKNNYKVNWSSFLGTDDPDVTRRMRFFNNFYGLLKLNEKWNIALGFDVGIQQVSKGSSDVYSWFGASINGQYSFNEKWQAAARIEYYSDPNEVIVTSVDDQNGYKTSGYSINVDYLVLKNLKWRLEARYFHSPYPIYPKSDGNVNNNFFLLTVLSFNFESKPIKL